jgi:glutathione S-transferase
VLTQSGVIQDYVSSKTGKLGGRSAAERRDILRWMFFDNHKVSGVAGPLRFLMNFLPEEKRNADVIAFMTARLLGALKIMETQLADTPYLTGDALTIADIACAGYLFYPEPFGFDRSDFPHIDAWMTRIEDTPRWKHPYDLMPGSPADRA